MRRLGGVAMAAVLSSSMLVLAAPAPAAVEVGNNVCPANESIAGYMAIQLSNSSGSLPLAAPSAGVATKWKVESVLANKPQFLKVVRPTGKKNEFLSVSKSTERTVVRGLNVFDTRIPVQQGDQFGLYGAAPSGALFCTGAIANPSDVMGDFGGDLQPDEAPHVFAEDKSARVAVSVVVEPDADGDGYGDETQDKCPQLAAFQVACPQVSIDAVALVEKSSASLLVTTDRAAAVSVSAHSGHKSKVARTSRRGPFLAILDGGTQTVVPGKLSRFKLKFPANLKAKLRSLSRRASLKLTIDADTRNEAGQLFSKTVVVKLKGRG